VHDTVEFDKRRLPVTVILTQACTNAAVFPFRVKGMEGPPSVALPPPLSKLTHDNMLAVT
jgi:hypothetical protein